MQKYGKLEKGVKYINQNNFTHLALIQIKKILYLQRLKEE